MRVTLFVTALLSVVYSTGLAQGQKSLVRDGGAAELIIVVRPATVEISGAISSPANQNILRATAARLHADRSPSFKVTVRTALPPAWALVTDLTLQTLAQTKSATATVRPKVISIRGFTEDRAAWGESVDRIATLLPAGWDLEYQVEEMAAADSMRRQCIDLFRMAIRGRPIEFERSSAELGSAAAPLLDELIQIAVDCPGSQVRIIGHTDNTGDESVNLALSRQRARAVADYLVAGGIAESRIHANGVGSARPLHDENTPRARRLNRRLELMLVFPPEN